MESPLLALGVPGVIILGLVTAVIALAREVKLLHRDNAKREDARSKQWADLTGEIRATIERNTGALREKNELSEQILSVLEKMEPRLPRRGGR